MHQILRQRISEASAGAADCAPAAADALQATLSHQPSNPFAVDLAAKAEAQLGGHPW